MEIPPISPEQRETLRELARHYLEIASGDAMRERVRLWKTHNSLKPERPMILLFPEGGWREIGLKRPEEMGMVCPDGPLREAEWHLRSSIYSWKHFDSDNVFEPHLDVLTRIWDTGWGVNAHWIHSEQVGGANKFDPVIHGPEDLKRMRYPEVVVDGAGTAQVLAIFQDVFGDILPVRQRGKAHVSFHLLNHWTSLRGLEETMMDMATEPEFVSEAMSFLEEGNRKLVEQWEALGLLELNNDSTYHSSGGVGWTDQLPAPDYDGGRVRPIDMWASAESQELTLVSPEMHWEFALQHECRLLEPFGLNGYACCDDLTLKLDYVKRIPRLRRVSFAPASDVARCAPQVGGQYIFSWKPQPAHLVGRFDEERIRAYLRHGIETAARHGCVLELILKDTHSCEYHPERFDRWSEIARDEVERA